MMHGINPARRYKSVLPHKMEDKFYNAVFDGWNGLTDASSLLLPSKKVVKEVNACFGTWDKNWTRKPLRGTAAGQIQPRLSVILLSLSESKYDSPLDSLSLKSRTVPLRYI
jgi:hypothetical protein